MLLARISLTLSRHFSLSFIASGRSSGLHPVSSHSCWMYVWASHPAFTRPYVGVHRSTSHMSSSLLLQQCPACLVRLLSEWWLRTKWIKHVTIQVGSKKPSNINVKINSQLKKFFPQPIMNFPSKVFWSRFDPKHSYKMVHKRSHTDSWHPGLYTSAGRGSTAQIWSGVFCLWWQLLSWGC